jgi:pimeloyl-ACP methyl ester carboxylesterase
MKNILISEPEDPILRKIAERSLGDPAVSVACFAAQAIEGETGALCQLQKHNGVLQPGVRTSDPVHEIWHTAKQHDPFPHSRAVTQRLLSLALTDDRPVLNYVSSMFAMEASTGRRVEKSARASIPGTFPGAQLHHWNEMAIEDSGCNFRILRLPLFSDWLPGPAHPWSQFMISILRFRHEIEDRIPSYFRFNRLRIELSSTGAVILSGVGDAVEILWEITSNKASQNRHFHVMSSPPVRLKAFFPAIAELAGVQLEAVPDCKHLNDIDRLFCLRVQQALPYLDCRTVFDFRQTIQYSQRAQKKHIQSLETKGTVRDWIANYECDQRMQERRALHRWFELEHKSLSLESGEVLNYYLGGKGKETLVVLNAYGQSFEYWMRLVAELTRTHRIILWIPHGGDFQTVGLACASSQGTHAEHLHRVLEREGVESCCLLGWCTGPKLAIEYCSRHPELVSCMVFVAPSFRGPAQFETMETSYERGLASLLEIIEQKPGLAALTVDALHRVVLGQRASAERCWSIDSPEQPDWQTLLSSVNVSLQSLVLQPFSSAEAIVAYAQQLHHFWRHDFTAVLGDIKAPVLFVGGEYDRIASPLIARSVAKSLPNAKYMEIKGGSHYLHYEHWDLLAEMIREFSRGREIRCKEPWVMLLDEPVMMNVMKGTPT